MVKNKFSPDCQTCKTMKANDDFRLAIMNSSYFNYHGTETAPQVMLRYNVKIPEQNFYAHCRRHQAKDMEARKMRLEILKQARRPLPNIQGVPIDIIKREPLDNEFRMGLDEFIKAGREKLKRGEMSITAQTYLQAIKIKVDDESKNKDRGVDLLKNMFKGADGGTGQ